MTGSGAALLCRVSSVRASPTVTFVGSLSGVVVLLSLRTSKEGRFGSV